MELKQLFYSEIHIKLSVSLSDSEINITIKKILFNYPPQDKRLFFSPSHGMNCLL